MSPIRAELLLAQARETGDRPVAAHRREIATIPESMALSNAFDWFLQELAHIMLVVDEHGGVEGVVTLEDILESLLGLELVDEGDRTDDMQELARRLWRRRAETMGVDAPEK